LINNNPSSIVESSKSPTTTSYVNSNHQQVVYKSAPNPILNGLINSHEGKSNIG
jgi:hypothetical protein